MSPFATLPQNVALCHVRPLRAIANVSNRSKEGGYSITSSASDSKLSESFRPSALAVF